MRAGGLQHACGDSRVLMYLVGKKREGVAKAPKVCTDTDAEPIVYVIGVCVCV